MADQARNDGETRTALFGMAVVAADSGKLDNAVQQIEKEYAVAEKKNDVAAMAADLQAKGNIWRKRRSTMPPRSSSSDHCSWWKDPTSRRTSKTTRSACIISTWRRLAIGKKDYNAAKTHIEEFRTSAEASKNPAQLKQAHELAGRIALAQKQTTPRARNWNSRTSRTRATCFAWGRRARPRATARRRSSTTRRPRNSIRCRR